jgi:hypothetical protein
MRITEWVDVPHGPGDLTGRNFEDSGRQRGIQIPSRSRLDPGVATLLDERRQPAKLQIAADDDQQVRSLKPQDVTRLGLDEMRILIPSRNGLHVDPITTDLACQRRQIFGRRDGIHGRRDGSTDGD